MTILDNLITPSCAQKDDENDSNYQSLEKVLQKYEAEIREHIRKHQQLEIYSDLLEEEIVSLKKKLKGSSKLKSHIKVPENQTKVKFFQKKIKKEQNKENSCFTYINRIRLDSADKVSL